MRGRKPQPTAIKMLNGNPGRRPLNENEPTPERGRPEAPEHLTGEARAEWDRVCDQLDGMGLLTTADRQVIALLCQSWAVYVEALKQVTEYGLIVKGPGGAPQQNNYLGIANTAFQQVKGCLVELGLTPSARSRVHAAPAAKPDNPFDSLLAGEN
jgi:P27 family predicted phage terminase small subunit